MSPSSESSTGIEKHCQNGLSHLKLVFDQTLITDEVRRYNHPGNGTVDEPYLVDWLPNDPKNGFNISIGMKWATVMICSFNTLACSLASTVFAVGPVLWGPLSELYGRQMIFHLTLGASVIFEGASIACKRQDITALIILRFLAGSFSASSISN
ncbi:Major facilitator superfamily domain general substrate transporter [Penicillium malachiteum]|uniref:Major facilitator superfamily domain general substrate transporter n=1 Tax=Penicillium malachiteum TaxID=1324776 RepID=A0AAD6N1F7_9EURO|nr:Major facilitator superfamily domain general substrate transporter [Penicillium malachiteum]